MTVLYPVPWWALLGIASAAGFIAWHVYSRAPLSGVRRGALASLRFVALMLIVLLLMRPVARAGPEGAADAVVPILVDTSRSMSIEDAHGARRIDRARELLTSGLLPSISARFQTEVLAFGEAVAPVAPAALGATARRSDLAGALAAVRERYRGRAVAGIVVLSDGGDTGAGASGADLAPIAPIFSIGIGAPAVGRDREVLSVTAAEAVLDDSRVDLAVSAVSHGYGTTPIEIRLFENGRPSEVRRVTPAADGTPVSEIFHATPGKGAPTVYTVAIPPASGEVVPENNTRSVLVQPPARSRRILLVQGAPGFEHSFLRRAWSADTGLEIDSVVRKGKNEQGADTFYIQASGTRGSQLVTGYPVTREDLFAYDAVVLANMEGGTLSNAELEATRDFVGRRGGGLLVLGAQSFLRRGLIDTPIEEVLPLDLAERGRGMLPSPAQAGGANRVALTTAGEAHPIMQLAPVPGETRKRWEAVPALASIAPLGGPRPGANVLAITNGPGGTPRALVAVQRYGEGRSMVFTGEAAWRWRMLLPATDRSYDTFWRQAIRWLSLAAPDPIMLVPPAGAAPGDIVTLRIAVRGADFQPSADATVDVRVTRPDGRVESLPAAIDHQTGGAGAFGARFHADEPGVYRATADVRRPGLPAVSASSALLVGGADPEMTDPRLNVRVLQRLALISGGRVVEQEQTTALASELRAALPEATLLIRRDLWNNGWSLAAIVGILASEWVLRRRWGFR